MRSLDGEHQIEEAPRCGAQPAGVADAGVTASSIYIEARDGVLVKWIVNANADDTGRLNHLMIKCTDTRGRRLAPVRSNGLVNRRRLETAPFRRQPGAQ
ncbi:hypothetical protein WJ96_11540 [Burkholderia ubonensis]|uniref:Uncharacterized protein n=1 Tax=Burkholderia ubonensis TaxID=101571 RepID=A0AAW3MSM4_9BURK|nr:hypothetical protein [Burkholderia ubonensis]KVP94270.1 hypothetical protein WJ96_11540 [Burkholderia ubonensis]